MRLLWRFLVAFLAITGAVALLTGFAGFKFGNANYWDYHGIFFLFFITLFPRLTLLISSIASMGIVWWLGWIFAPRLLVAVLATLNYWYQNPILVMIAWFVALGGESSEKYFIVQQSRPRERDHYRSARWVDADDVK